MAKRDTLENAIKMLVRIQIRMMREDNVGLRWTMTWEPVLRDKPEPDKRRSALNRGVAK